jgi:Tfp pilus assembly protein PilN
MKQKFAIGITINGTEVRAAFMSLIRNKAVIKALESTKLPAPLEHTKTRQKQIHESVNDLENAFDINMTELEPDDEHPDSGEHNSKDRNVSAIYALLDKFQNIKANLAINAPLLTVKYDYVEKQAVEKDKDFKKRVKEKINVWGDDNNEIRRTNYIEISDSRYLQVDYEYHPPVIDLMEEVNQFRSGNLDLALMDTNELALVELVREIYKFEKEEVTAIIYIEEDFSRVIFLKGSEIYHITPIVHKGSTSPDVLDVIYSRIIFAQDQHFIPELNKILVAGHSSRLKAKYYFRQKFPYAITGYLNSKKIRSDLRFKDRGLLFSRYAVPIALAWKALQKNTYTNKATNLLPEYVVEKQRLPKLAVHGYFLLAVMALTGFAFTLFISKKNAEISRFRKEITVMQRQIESNTDLTERVRSFDTKIMEIENKTSVVDSFSKNHDDVVLFLQKLNGHIQQIGGIWITDLSKGGESVQLSGLSTRRESIPLLANALGGASLKKVTRSSMGSEDVFAFQMEKKLHQDEDGKNLSIFSILGNSQE